MTSNTLGKDLAAATYQRHSLHGEGVVWQEKNCYVDLWIELLHAHGLAPEAMLPAVIGTDCEGDQWTFFKPSHDELYALYGVAVNELTVWRPLLDHALEQRSRGRFVLTEADAFWLPDTRATTYRRQHAKTTITLVDIDVAGQRLGYFHNAGYYTLSERDFVETFRLDAPADPDFMPFFAETACFGRAAALPPDALRQASRALWRKHLERTPPPNPVLRFAQRFADDLPALQRLGMDHYNAWAFATLRQMGASFEMAAQSLHWLGGDKGAECPEAAQAFMQIAHDSQALIFKGARAIALGRPLDPLAQLAGSATAWETAMQALREQFATR